MRETGLPILLVVLAWACSGGGGGDPQAAGSSASTGAGGPTGAAAPTGAAGSSGAVGTAGSPASSGSAGSTSSTGPATGGGDTVVLERLDASAECDGLVPERAPAPIDVHRSPPPGATCAGGLSDGTGHVAVAARDGEGATWQVFGPDGAAAGVFPAWPLVPEPSGWHGLRVAASADGTPVEHVHVSPEGGVIGAAPVNADPAHLQSSLWSLAQDPRGGCFALVGEVDRFHNHFTALEAQRFDAGGAARWPQNVRLPGNGDHAFEFLAAGVSTGGEALVLWQRSAFVDVLWLDAAGGVAVPQTEAERAEDALGSARFHTFALELAPLLDGALALRADGRFQRVYPRRATLGAPLPDWLARRADWTFRFTRGDRGYAVLPPPGQPLPGCDQAIDLVAPSGRLCGRVTLRGDGSACTSGAVDQGWDGTVVRQTVKDGCDYRFWPGLLAR